MICNLIIHHTLTQRRKSFDGCIKFLNQIGAHVVYYKFIYLFFKILCHLQSFENNLLVFDISILILQHVQMSSNLGLFFNKVWVWVRMFITGISVTTIWVVHFLLICLLVQSQPYKKCGCTSRYIFWSSVEKIWNGKIHICMWNIFSIIK